MNNKVKHTNETHITKRFSAGDLKTHINGNQSIMANHGDLMKRPS